MSLFRETVERMKPYVPGEQPRDRRFVKLNTNENPYPPSPKVLEALREAVGERLRLYPLPMADDLRERIARLHAVKPANVLVGNGSDDLLAMIVRAVVEPGTRVAYPVPTYSLYDTLVELYDGISVHIPFDETFALPEELVEADAALVFLANPNSPSATLIPPDDVVRVLRREDRLVVVDEAYVDFARESCLGLLADHPNLVILRTLSKSFSLAGMRIGYALASERVIRTLAKVKDSYNVDRLSIVAGVAALRDVRWMEANVRRVQATRDQLTCELAELGARVLPSEANFVLARWPGRNVSGIYETLKRRGVLVRYFRSRDLEDSLRITVGTDDEVRVFLRVLRQVLQTEARRARAG